MNPKTRRAAWIQGVLLLGAIVALAVTLHLRLGRPFDRDTLAIPVDELHSEAAEADLLEQQMRRDHVTPAFVRFQAQQLGHDVERVRGDLGGKHADGALDALRAQALLLGGTLQARLDTLARHGDLPRATSLHFDVLAQAFEALGKRIKPED